VRHDSGIDVTVSHWFLADVDLLSFAAENTPNKTCEADEAKNLSLVREAEISRM